MKLNNKSRLRKELESNYGPLEDKLYNELLKVTRDDIRANVQLFNKTADYDYVYYIASTYLLILRRNHYDN